MSKLLEWEIISIQTRCRDELCRHIQWDRLMFRFVNEMFRLSRLGNYATLYLKSVTRRYKTGTIIGNLGKMGTRGPSRRRRRHANVKRR